MCTELWESESEANVVVTVVRVVVATVHATGVRSGVVPATAAINTVSPRGRAYKLHIITPPAPCLAATVPP